jgi:hypothetical protein
MSPETARLALSLTVSSLGLLGLVVCRIGEKSGRCSLCQMVFLGAMILVALATLTSLALHTSDWVLSGTTLAAMAVGGTLHTGPAPASRTGR